MSDVIEVDGDVIVVDETDVDVVTIAPGDTVPFKVEDSGTVKVSNTAGINFKTNLDVTDDGDSTVTVDVGSGVMLVDGSRAMTGNLDMGSNNVNNAANLVDLASAQTITGAKTLSALLTANGGISLGNETLSNYDEGTWTPVLAGVTTAGSHTYSAQVGTYTRIGRFVHISFNLTLSNYDTGAAGAAEIQGLPFAQAATQDREYVGFTTTGGINTAPTGFSELFGSIRNSVIRVRYRTSSAGENNYDIDDLATNSLRLRGSATYEV